MPAPTSRPAIPPITAALLTEAIGAAEPFRGARVGAFRAEPIEGGTSYTSSVMRLWLDYEPGGVRGPASLVAKQPSPVAEVRSIAAMFRLYEREVRFYEALAARSAIEAPACIFQAHDASSDNFLLLLEDLAPARALGDQLAGGSSAQADLAVRAAARFHAKWWNAIPQGIDRWMPRWDDGGILPIVQGAFAQSWPLFMARFGADLPERVTRLGEGFVERIPGLLRRLSEPPHAICHGDYRVDNMFFATDAPGAVRSIAVIDWQLCCRGRGVADIAYFLTQSLPVGLRRAREKTLVESYHRELTANGVTGYSLAQCRADYKAASLYCLVYPVITAPLATEEKPLTILTAAKMAARTAAAIADLDLDFS